MRFRGMIAASATTVAALAGIAWAAAGRFPPGAQLPMHWNAAGEADRFADAYTALAMPVLLAAAISALMAAIPKLEPLQRDLEESAPLLRAAWAGLLGLCAVVQIAVAGPAFGLSVGPEAVLAATGLLLAVVGNALPKSRPGFFVGFRTPWAIADPDNWIATHRLAARTMTAGGLLIATAALLPISADARVALVAAALTGAIFPPLAYSFLLWRRMG